MPAREPIGLGVAEELGLLQQRTELVRRLSKPDACRTGLDSIADALPFSQSSSNGS